jgi:hypothetical protein
MTHPLPPAAPLGAQNLSLWRPTRSIVKSVQCMYICVKQQKRNPYKYVLPGPSIGGRLCPAAAAAPDAAPCRCPIRRRRCRRRCCCCICCCCAPRPGSAGVGAGGPAGTAAAAAASAAVCTFKSEGIRPLGSAYTTTHTGRQVVRQLIRHNNNTSNRQAGSRAQQQHTASVTWAAKRRD